MERRRFLRIGLGAPWLGAAWAQPTASPAPAAAGAPAASLAGAPVPALAPAPAPPSTAAPLAAYALLGPEAVLGRVACVTGLCDPDRPPASNRDPVPDARVAARLDAGLSALLGPDPWSRICGPRDVVALKLNGLAAGALSPRPELVRAVAAGLRRAGVAPGNVIVWDRSTREVARCGFALQTDPGEMRAYGTDALRGGGYGDALESFGSVGSFVSRIASEYATVLISIGVLKDHDLCGVSAGMKNLYGAIHNPNRYHDHHCDPFVAEVAALPSLRGKLRLTIVDGILAQAEGGPAFAPAWVWPGDRILLAVDPVACDQVAWELIEARRAALGLPTLEEAGRPPLWIDSAARLGLGRSREITRLEV